MNKRGGPLAVGWCLGLHSHRFVFVKVTGCHTSLTLCWTLTSAKEQKMDKACCTEINTAASSRKHASHNNTTKGCCPQTRCRPWRERLNQRRFSSLSVALCSVNDCGPAGTHRAELMGSHDETTLLTLKSNFYLSCSSVQRFTPHHLKQEAHCISLNRLRTSHK